MRWLLPALLLAAWQVAGAPTTAPVAGSSGQHAWWVLRDGDAWVVQHAPRARSVACPARRDVARFDDEPVAIACDEAMAWIVFRGARGRSEVLEVEAARNPASGLWFNVPTGGRLRPSVPAERVQSVAALRGEPWVLVQDASKALRLQGEAWLQVALPDAAASAPQRALVAQDGGMWCVARCADGASRRWRFDGGDVWIERPLQVQDWSSVVPGCERLTFIRAGRLAVVQAGVADTLDDVPENGTPLGWGDGVLALRVSGDALQASVCPAPGSGFGAFESMAMQRSAAARWFHLPLLAVLSLGALMLAGIVRAVRGGGVAAGPASLALGRRAAALVIDLLPLAGTSLLVFEADLWSLLCVPLWTTDLRDCVPFVAVVLGGAVFGTLEESTHTRSLGKRLVGGCVLRRDGSRAGWPRHLARNVLKAIVLLSPVLALPTLLGRRGEGVPEVVSGTVVACG